MRRGERAALGSAGRFWGQIAAGLTITDARGASASNARPGGSLRRDLGEIYPFLWMEHCTPILAPPCRAPLAPFWRPPMATLLNKMRTNGMRVISAILTLICSGLAAHPASVEAATYYVRTDGNDANTGTGSDAASAWATFSRAATAALAPGDVVYFQAGSYAGEGAATASGTLAGPIQFIADRNGSVSGWTAGEILVQAQTGQPALGLQTNEYLQFTGFRFVGLSSGGDPVLELEDAVAARFEKCVIEGGDDAGIETDTVSGSTSATIINCLIKDNTNDGIKIDAGTLTIWNTTIVNNGSDGVEQNAGSLTVTNCIVANNGSDGLDRNGGSMTHTYNLVYGSGDNDFEGITASTGEISVDPLFVGGGDYRLQPSSPAIDASNQGSGVVTDDIRDVARPVNSMWDLGCYEGSTTIYYVRTDGNDANAGTGADAASAWASVAGAATKPLNPGDIIYVRAGTYTGEVKPTADGSVGDAIKFIADTTGSTTGWSAGDVIIQAPSSNQALDLEDADYLQFIGFKLSGVAGHNTVEIELGSDDITLDRCEIYVGNRIVHVRDNSSCLIRNCLLRNADYEGLDIDGASSDVTVWNSTIVDNGDNGIQLRNGSVVVTNSIVAFNGGFGLQRESGIFTHTYNDVYSNGTDYVGTSAGTGEISSDPLFLAANDYRLGSGSPAADAGAGAAGFVDEDLRGVARPQDSAWDMGCYETAGKIYYVRTDGSNSNTGIAPTTSEAWATVAYAASQPLTPYDVIYVRAGTYAGTVAVSVDGTATSRIQFIADAKGTVSGWPGGAVVLQAPASGKALDIDNDDYIEFRGFTIAGDAGNDAVDVDDSQGVVLTHCEVQGGNRGVEVDEGAEISIVNCLIHSNNKGIEVINGDAAVWNCTIANNSSDGVEQDLGTSTITNCIISGNGDAGIDVNGGALSHTYNLVHGNVGGDFEGTSSSTGEISVDPEFANTVNFRLKPVSPALDAGTSAMGLVDDDLLGVLRPEGLAWDMGCYEGDCLEGHWKLTETTGTTAADSSASALDGTYVNGVTLNAAGPYPGEGDVAAEFDGSNDRVDLPTMNVDFSGGLTIAVWYKVASLSGGHSDFFSLSNGVLADDLWFGLDHSQGLELFLSDTVDGASYRNVVGNDPPDIDTWHHGVVVVDAAGNATIYRDGVVVASGYSGLPQSVTRTQNRIGLSVFNLPTTGKMFDARLYCYPLSAEEVAELYGLVGHWKFDEGTGTVAADSSGNANDSTLINGATWTTDCKGRNALETDGIGGIARTNANVDPPLVGTVAFWMRAAGELTSRQRPFGVNGNWEGRVETSGLMKFDLGNSPYFGNEPFSTASTVSSLDRWYHIVASYDSPSDAYEVYVDGKLEASGISPRNLVKQGAGILSFGARTGSSEYWKGALRDFRVYNRWLSGSEISDLSGLVGHWRFDETSGTVAADSTGNGNDGTYTNSPTLGVTSKYPPTLGTAVGFDGTNDYVEMPHARQMLADEGTITFWVKANDLSGAKGLFSKDSSGFDTGGHLTIRLINNNVVVRLQSTSASYTLTSSPFTANKWCQVAFTWGSNGMILYLNGVEDAADPSYTGGLGASSGGTGNFEPIVVGANSWASGNLVATPLQDYHDGAIDDLHFFARQLCPEEIFNGYIDGRGPGIRIIQWVEVR